MADLVLLHGPPASGKFTIANEISKLVKARVFHNHLTLDVAKSLLNFGDPGFWDQDHELFKQFKSIASSANARVFPVFLSCELPVLESRAANAHRQDMNKLSDKERLREIVLTKNYCAIPDELCITVDTNTEQPESNARKIIDKFKL